MDEFQNIILNKGSKTKENVYYMISCIWAAEIGKDKISSKIAERKIAEWLPLKEQGLTSKGQERTL